MDIRVLESDHPGTLTEFLLKYVTTLPTQTAVTGIPVEVNHSRWVVNCPFCASAQLASEADPKFFCVACKNAGVGGKWLPVVWPGNRQALEALLAVRPDERTRNWKVGETAQDLARENALRGI